MVSWASASERANLNQVPVLQSQQNGSLPSGLIEKGIHADNLPPGRIVQPEEASFWDLYKWRLIGLTCFCIIGTLLIVDLITKWKKKRQDGKPVVHD